jgi:electron transfer flavoprotein alpha subunit
MKGPADHRAGGIFAVCGVQDDPEVPSALLSLARCLGGESATPARLVEVSPSAGSPLAAAWEGVARVLEERAANLVLMGDGDEERLLAALVARRLGSMPLFGCRSAVASSEGPVFRVPVHGGRLEQDICFAPGATPVVTVDREALVAGRQPSGERPPADAVVSADAGWTDEWRSLEISPPDFRTVDLVDARRVLAAGMGAVDPPLFAQAEELAELLEASLGTTRPMVDEGRLPQERLIGQTGRTVAPDLYLSLGVSGSPHHLAGVQQAGRLLSVDKDPRAPVFQYSDAAYLADLEVVLPGLIRRIKEWRDDVER